MAEVISGSVSKNNPDCRICDLKEEIGWEPTRLAPGRIIHDNDLFPHRFSLFKLMPQIRISVDRFLRCHYIGYNRLGIYHCTGRDIY